MILMGDNDDVNDDADADADADADDDAVRLRRRKRGAMLRELTMTQRFDTRWS